MKYSDIKAPKGTTHVRVDIAGGKNTTVELKRAAASFDGVEGEFSFFKMVKNKLTPIPLHPHGKPTAVVIGFLNQQDGTVHGVRLMDDSAKETGKALKALAAKFGGGTWSRAETVPDGDPTIDLTISPAKKAKPGKAVEKSNIVPLKDREAAPAKDSKDAPAPKAKAAKDAKDEDGKRGTKGPFIDTLLTGSHAYKLSTILEKTMAAYPEGNAIRTLRRIRKQADALKSAGTKLTFIDEPDFKASK